MTRANNDELEVNGAERNLKWNNASRRPVSAISEQIAQLKYCRQVLMCQHFSGHKVKRLYTAIRSLRATNSRWQNAVARGCKRLQYIQTQSA